MVSIDLINVNDTAINVDNECLLSRHSLSTEIETETEKPLPRKGEEEVQEYPLWVIVNTRGRGYSYNSRTRRTLRSTHVKVGPWYGDHP